MRIQFILFTLLLGAFSLGFSSTDPVNFIEATIDPNLPTDIASNRFSNLTTLLFVYHNLNFSQPTLFTINIPYNTTVRIDQMYFKNTLNLEVVIQGKDKKTSVLSFSSIGSLNSKALDFVIQNVSIKSDRRESDNLTTQELISVSEGSLSLIDVDLDLQDLIDTGCNYDEYFRSYKILDVKRNLLLKRVNATLSGKLTLINQNSSILNVTIEDSIFNLSRINKELIFIVADEEKLSYQFVSLSNITFNISDSCENSRQYGSEAGLLDFCEIDQLKVNSMESYLNDNVDIYDLFMLKSVISVEINDFYCHFVGSNIRFSRIIRSLNFNTEQGLRVVFSDIKFEGNMKPFIPTYFIDRETNTKVLQQALLDIQQRASHELTIKRIIARNLFLNETIFMAIRMFMSLKVDIDSIMIFDSVINHHLIKFESLISYWGRCSLEMENETTFNLLNAFEIINSTINVNIDQGMIVLSTDCATQNLKKLFMNTFNLTNWNFSNNTILTKNSGDLQKRDFIVVKGWNLLISNFTFVSNDLQGINIINVEGPQPILKISKMKFLSNNLNASAILRKDPDPATFICSIDCEYDIYYTNKMHNYRYMMIEDSIFANFSVSDAAIFFGDLTDLFVINNTFERITMKISSIFNLNYFPCEEKPPSPFSLLDYFQESILFVDPEGIYYKGEPNMFFIGNKFENMVMYESMIMNLDTFDYFKILKRYDSNVRFQFNNFTNLTGSSQGLNNLFNLWCVGNVDLYKNQFSAVMIDGMIFSIVNNECDSRIVSPMEGYGKFIIDSNSIDGNLKIVTPHPNDMIIPLNQTGFLEFSASSVASFKFMDNFITSCNTFNRGFVDISINNLIPPHNFTITGNKFYFNKLSIRNSLKANFFRFEYRSESIGKDKLLLKNNAFISNSIEGDSFFTGSLLSLIPTLIQIEALDCYVIFNQMAFIGNRYRPHGFLATVVAGNILINNTQITANLFHEVPRLASSKSDITKQGLFFLGTYDVWIENVEFSYNVIAKGSFLSLDNSWSNIFNSRLYPKDYEIFKLLIKGCNLTENEVKNGAIALFSGGSYSIDLSIDEMQMFTRGASMQYLIQAEDVGGLRFILKHSNIAIQMSKAMGYVNSNLFSFGNFRFLKNNGTTLNQTVFPIIIDNCTFYFEGTPKAKSPRIQITNPNRKLINYWVLFSNSKFIPISSDYLSFANGINFEIIGSKVMIENCTFERLNFTDASLFDLSGSATLKITNSIFQDNSFLNSGLIESSDSFVVFDQTAVAVNKFGHTAFHIEAIKSEVSFDIINSNFSGNKLSKGAFLIYNQDNEDDTLSSLYINNTLFESNILAPDSTCVFNFGRNTTIRASSFVKNYIEGLDSLSLSSPAIENIGEGKLRILNCSFIENKGVIGGAIRTVERVSIVNSSFIQNNATIGGGAIYFLPDLNGFFSAELQNNLMIENRAPIGNDYLGIPSYLEYEIVEIGEVKGINLLTKDKQILIKFGETKASLVAKFIPGSHFNHILKIYVCDRFGNRLKDSIFKYFEDANLKISTVNSTSVDNSGINSYYYYSTEKWNGGLLQLNGSNLRLVAPFGSYVHISITAKLLDIKLNLTLAAQANLTCLRGQVYDAQSMICQPCKSGWYSLNYSDISCSPCPNNANCNLGEDKILIDEGYWANLSSSRINPIKCLNNRKACQGGLESKCKTGYSGAACEDCDYFDSQKTGFYYSKSQIFRCKECPSSVMNVLIAVLASLVTLISETVFIAINIFYNENHVKRVLERQQTEVNLTGAYTRLLITFMQILGIIQTFSFQLPDLITVLYAIGNPTSTLFYTTQCLIIALMDKYSLNEKISFPYLIMSVISAGIVLKLIFYTAIWMFLRCCCKEKIKSRHLIIAFISILYLEQPSLINSLYGVISCKVIDERSVLARFQSYDCSTSEHLFFHYKIVIPVIVLVAFMLPFVIFLIILRERRKSTTENSYTSYGTLTIEYKSQHFYWPFVVLFFKFVLITLSNVFPNNSDMDLKVMALGLLLVFAIYLAAISHFEPYNSPRVYDMDRYLTYASITTIFFSYLSLDSNAEEVPRLIYAICFGIILVTNLMFLVYSAGAIFKANSKDAQNVLKQIKKYISKIPKNWNDTKEERALSEKTNNESIQEQILDQPLIESDTERNSKRKSVEQICIPELKLDRDEESKQNL